MPLVSNQSFLLGIRDGRSERSLTHYEDIERIVGRARPRHSRFGNRIGGRRRHVNAETIVISGLSAHAILLIEFIRERSPIVF